MAGIVYARVTGPIVPVTSTISLTESNYTGITPLAKTLYVQTGTGVSDRIHYGLTTDTTARQYSPTFNVGGSSCYIARETTYYTESESESTYTQTYTNTVTNATTRESWYNVDDVVVTTSSTISTASSRSSYLYEFVVTSKPLGETVEKNLTLTNTSFYSNAKYYYFSTTDNNTHSASANSLTYKYVSRTLQTYNLMNAVTDRDWNDNPTNNITYSYYGTYKISGNAGNSTTNHYMTLNVTDTVSVEANPFNSITNSASSCARFATPAKTATRLSNVSKSYYTAGTATLAIDKVSSSNIYDKVSKYGSGTSSTVAYGGVVTRSYANYYTASRGYTNTANQTTNMVHTWSINSTYGYVYNIKYSNATLSTVRQTIYFKSNTTLRCSVVTNAVANTIYSNSFSLYNESYGRVTNYSRSASAYVITKRESLSRASNYTETNTVTETETVTEVTPVPYVATSNNCNF